MSVSPTSGFSALQQIGQTTKQIAQVHRSEKSEVINHVKAVDSKAQQSSNSVISNAVETKSSSVATKGRMIDVMV
jgi:hypothetical protein